MKCWPGQTALLKNQNRTEHAYVAGVGTGKTHFLVRWHHARCLWNMKSKLSLVGAPKHDLLLQNAMPLYQEFLESLGMRNGHEYNINRSNMYLEYNWGHRVLFRTLHRSSIRQIVAYTLSHASVDEAGLCDEQTPIEITKRCRCSNANVIQKLYVGTPEGINYFSKRFGEGLKIEGRYRYDKHRLVVNGSSYDNKELPEEYLEELEREFGWNESLRKAYIMGIFCPIYQDSAYDFRQDVHVGDYPKQLHQPIHLTWDFNVGRVGLVTWSALQAVGADLHVVACSTDKLRTTEEACAQFLEAFPPHTWSHVDLHIHGDFSGWQRDTRSYGTDYDIIRQTLQPYFPNLKMRHRKANPSIGLRIAAVNRLFSEGYDSSLLIDQNCHKVIESFNLTAIDEKGDIKKPGSYDTWTHWSDNVGYAVVDLKPIKRPVAQPVEFNYA